MSLVNGWCLIHPGHKGAGRTHVATHVVTLYSVTKVIPIATCLNHQQTFSDASVKQPAYKWVYTQKNERGKKMRKINSCNDEN